MKKLLVLLSVGVLVLGMTACGNGEENANQSTEQTATTQTEEIQTQENQEGENQAENTETAGDTTESITASEDTTGGMDTAVNWSDEMAGIKQAVMDALGENYWPNMQIDAQILESIYGITPDMYDDYMGEMPMISTNVDTLLIIKAKDDKVEAVEEALNAYRDALVADTNQYPMNVGKIQASRIQRYDNYVCFVQLGADTMAASESGDEAVIQQCQEQNELALEVIGKNIPR